MVGFVPFVPSCLRGPTCRWLLILGLSSGAAVGAAGQEARERHFLYVALPDSDTDVDPSIRILIFDIANGITWAADNGAQVINLSLGGPSISITLYDAIDYARRKGAVVVSAAGNDGAPLQSYPGAYPDPITQTTATAIAEAEEFRFDLSDVQPSEFGATEGQGLWKLFQDFLKTPSNVDGIASQLEAAAAAAYK